MLNYIQEHVQDHMNELEHNVYFSVIPTYHGDSQVWLKIRKSAIQKLKNFIISAFETLSREQKKSKCTLYNANHLLHYFFDL